MSRMAMLWIALYGGGLAAGLLHPIYPLLAYLTFYYLPPQLNWWGSDLPDLRYSLTASFVLLGSLVLLRSRLEPLKEERNPALPWLVLFGANCVLVTSAWALDTARSWEYALAVLKLILLCMLMPAAIRTPAQFDMFGAAHVAGAWYWGYKAWDNPHRKDGRLAEVGGPDTQDDNQAAGHLLTVLPFAALYVLTEKRKVRRVLFCVGAAFIVNTFILCNSRGATIGMVAAGLAAILLAGKGRRWRLMIVGLAGAAAVLFLADPEFITRQQTTTNPQDNSALSRLDMWRAGVQMVRDYPLGGGGRAYHIRSPKYIPEILARNNVQERSPHNTFVQLATDWGVQGAALFIGFLSATGRLLRSIRKRTPGNHWYFYRALTIQCALIGTFAASFFSSRLYGESIYWMCALAFALHRIQSTELAAGADAAELPHPASATAVLGSPGAALIQQREPRIS